MLARTTPPTPRLPRIQSAAWLAAGMLIVMLVAQLFTYESFASVLSVVLPFNDSVLVTIASAKVVVLELLALPFLLNMRLSRLMRFVSAACAIVISVFWFFIVLTNAHVSNSALFGDTLKLPGGAVAAIWAAILLGALIYVCMWSMREAQPRS